MKGLKASEVTTKELHYLYSEGIDRLKAPEDFRLRYGLKGLIAGFSEDRLGELIEEMKQELNKRGVKLPVKAKD